jgi:hypothetical protein
VVVAAGCGGSGGSHGTTTQAASAVQTGGSSPSIAVDDYQRRVVDAISAMGRFATTFSKVRAGNLKKLAPEFSSEASAFAGKAAIVERLDPPAKLRAAHQRLVAALQAVSSAMSDISSATAGGDRSAFLNADDAFVQASDKVSAAARALQAASAG